MNRAIKFSGAAMAALMLVSASADEIELAEEEGAYGWTPIAVSLASPVQLPWGINRWDVFGLDLGIFYNDSPKVYGLDVALATTTRDTFRGLAASGVFNYASKDVYGIRATLGGNLCRGTTYGADFGGVGLHKNIYGLDTELVCGVQENICGAQISLIANVTMNESCGATISGANYAKTAYGAQVGFLYNHAEELHGCQIAIVNFAKNCVWGFQIGLVNIITSNVVKVLPIVNGFF